MSRKDFVGIGKQAALKTLNPTPAFFPPVTNESFSIERESMSVEETLGTRAANVTEYGGRVYKGDLELAFRPVSAPLILSSFFGSPTTTVVVAGAYSHVFDPLAAGKKPTPLSIFTVNADVSPAIVDAYVGAVCDDLEISVEANDFVMLKAGFVAASLDQTKAAPTATRDASERFPFTVVTAQISVAGGALTTIPLSGFTLKAKNNIDAGDFVLGDEEVYGLDEGNLEIEVEFTAKTDISGHYRRALKDTPEDCRLVLSAIGSTIAATAQKNSIIVDLKRLQYVEAPVEIDGGSTLKNVTIKATAVLDETTSQVATVTVINANAGTNY